jgi:hypothetical protein
MLKVLSSFDLDLQMLFIKLTIKNNVNSTMVLPQKVNPLTRIWTSLVASLVIILKLPKYFKLAKIAMVQMIGYVEDEMH